ncbi:MAG: GatB/YqeY domain-containing protein [Patescibacteria group bacterium]
MISDTVKQQIVVAMKAKDEVRLSTLRLLSSELHNAKIDKRDKLTEDEELEVVRREAKKRRDAIEAYEKAGAKDRADKEEEELKILQEFLPKELSDEKLEQIVTEVITETGAKDVKEMGKVIGLVMGKVKGRAEGGRVADLVRRKLK